MAVTYMAHFNYQCGRGLQINFELVLNTAYSCSSSMYWPYALA